MYDNYLKEAIEQYTHDNFYFVQIGACDGVYVDPIYKFVLKYNWKGVLIEPVPYLFKELKENYKNNEGLIFENIAISDKEQTKPFYYVDPRHIENIGEEYPSLKRALDMRGISGFYRDNWLKKKRPQKDIDWYNNVLLKHMIEIPVECMTLDMLYKKYNITKLDLLQIDAEGFDWDIVKQIDRIKPKIVHYETSYIDVQQCTDFLENKGYKVINYHNNALAVWK